MSLVEELIAENNEIKELSTVLEDLISNPSMRTNSIFCELLQRFQNKLGSHLKHEARSIYSDLLNDADKNKNKIASEFLSNTRELERIQSSYVKRWCNNNNDNQQEFEKETKDMFKLVKDRIQMEESHLFSAL
ncbi:MAG: hypothetical protein OEY78_07825 [Gammaproteobacteria bacterium]|nr:hypothetical protein [Gammaproteobacteria bacterium]